jgi:hypothetical protein
VARETLAATAILQFGISMAAVAELAKKVIRTDNRRVATE